MASICLLSLVGCATGAYEEFDVAVDTSLPDTTWDVPADIGPDTTGDPADVPVDDVTWDPDAADPIDDTVTDDVSWDPDAGDTVTEAPTDTSTDTAPDTSGCTVFGTDTFGYTGCHSSPGSTGCDDVSSTGSSLTTGDDEHDRAPIGFTFSFYGITYTDVSVGTNGQVYFIDDYLGLGNVCLPGDPGYSGILTWIAGYWTDLHSGMETGNGIWYQTLGTAPYRRLVVQWDTGYCCSSYGSSVEFTIVLYETSNDIRVCYGNTTIGDSTEDLGASATSGIQRDLSDSLEYSCDSPSLTASLQLDYFHP
jgi:hypothetical protein